MKIALWYWAGFAIIRSRRSRHVGASSSSSPTAVRALNFAFSSAQRIAWLCWSAKEYGTGLPASYWPFPFESV